MSIYSQYDSSDNTNNTNSISILKDDFLITKNDYEKEMINRQYNQLYFNSMNDSNKLQKESESKIIYNLSIKEIFQNMSNTLIKIINEFSILLKNEDKNYNKYIEIFIKDDRMIYIGIIFIILGLIIFFIFASS
jgi:hypothetical protein